MNLGGWFKHFFTPHHTNNCRARILHPSVLSLFVAFFILGQFALNFYLLISPSVLGFASNISPERVIEITNQKRAENGLAPLTINGNLSEAAQRKAGDMFAFNYWAHVSPSGRTPWSFFKEVGYTYLYAGENLAKDFMNSESVVDAWMNSPTHKDNILNGNYKEIGLSVVNGTLNGVETTLVVQLFGTPTPAATAKTQTVPQKTTVLPTSTPTPIAQIAKEIEITPTPIQEIVEEELSPLSKVALAQSKGEVESPPLLSPFMLTKTIAIFLLGLILGALALDVVLVSQRRIVRLSGKNLAHLIFIGALLLSAILTTPGAIL